MGNSTSSNVTSDVVNKSVTDVLISSSQTCSQTNSLSQNISITDIDAGNCTLNISDISQTSVQTPNFSCSSNSENSSNLMSDFKNKLQTNADSAISGLNLNIASNVSSNVVNNVSSYIENNVNMSTVSKCVQDNLSKQNINAGKLKGCPAVCGNPNPPAYLDLDKLSKLCTLNISNLTQNATQSIVGDCLAENKQLTEVINKAENDIASSATAKMTGVSLAGLLGLDSMFGGLGQVGGIIVMIVIFLIFGVVAYFLLKK
jgi:hypothetical protein